MNRPMSEEKLQEIHAALGTIAPAPWHVTMEIDGVRAGRMTVVKAYNKRVFTVDQTRPHHDDTAEANAAFAAAARTWVPELVAEVRRLRALIDRLEG